MWKAGARSIFTRLSNGLAAPNPAATVDLLRAYCRPNCLAEAESGRTLEDGLSRNRKAPQLRDGIIKDARLHQRAKVGPGRGAHLARYVLRRAVPDDRRDPSHLRAVLPLVPAERAFRRARAAVSDQHRGRNADRTYATDVGRLARRL
jgi:hypothetical protein